MNKYKVGDVITVVVTGVEPYGIFVSVDKNVNGLIHISEVSNSFVRNVNDYVDIGEKIFAKVIDDSNDNHLKLSIKDIMYRTTGEKRTDSDENNGFSSLKKQLDVWIKEGLEQIKN